MKQFLFVLTMFFSVSAFAQTEDYVSLLNQLTTDDVIEVTYSSQGCFSSTSETISLSKKGNNLVGLFTGESGKQEFNFSPNQLVAFSDFEEQLFSMKNKVGLCTNTETYVIKLNGKVQHSFIDSSCSSWSGFTDLKHQVLK